MCRRFTMLTFPETLEVIRCLDQQEPCTMMPSWPIDKPLERSTSIYPPLSRDLLERAGGKPRTDALPGSRVDVIVAHDADTTHLTLPEAEKHAHGSWGVRLNEARLFDGPESESDMARPAQDAPLRTPSQNSRFATAQIAWGFKPEREARLLYNTRVESALSVPLWRDAAERRRCLIPTWGFFETHVRAFGFSMHEQRIKRQVYHFYKQPYPLTLLAGIFEYGRFSILTTDAPGGFADIHNRMPVVIDASDALQWLNGGIGSLKLPASDMKAVPLYAENDEGGEQLSLFLC